MDGLGINLGPMNGEPAPLGLSSRSASQNIPPPPKSSRRRAIVRHKQSQHDHRAPFKQGSNGAPLSSMPLRENNFVNNKNLNSSPMYVLKHPLPAKPTVEWTSVDDVQPASATKRTDTPSDTSTPLLNLSSQQVLGQMQTRQSQDVWTGAAGPQPFAPHYLSLQSSQASTPTPLQQIMHSLPSKPSVPIFPPERDERVGIELFLENNLVVEGGSLYGCIQLDLPNHTDPSTAMLLAQPRVRLIGYECLPDEDIRHIFFRHMSVIDGDRSLDGPSEPYILHGSSTLSQGEGGESAILPCFASLPDSDGFYLGQQGKHTVPFSISVPMGKGAKGAYKSATSEVGYILIASVRVKAFGERHSGVAHCFQKVQLYPYLNPTAELASAPSPIICHANTPEAEARNIRLAAALHRETCVAGQRVYFEMSVFNGSPDLINVLRIALVRMETLYRAHDHIPGSKDILSCTTSIVTDETLAANQLGNWWTGAPSGKPVHFPHSLELPPDVLSIEPGRHVSVQYMLRIGVGADTSTLVEVDLPLRIIKYVSLDPPPLRRAWMRGAGLFGRGLGQSADQSKMVERLQSLDAMRSPRTMPSNDLLLPEEAPSLGKSTRTTQHKRSLEFINSAIRSATARHTSPYTAGEALPTGLGIELAQNVTPTATISSAPSPYERVTFGHSLPVLEINNVPTQSHADVSLPLGDETVDDVELVFGENEKGQATGDDSTRAQQSCQDMSSGNLSTTSNVPEMERSISSSRLDNLSFKLPTTPKRENVVRASASLPRELRPKSSFTYTTNTTPLKVRRSHTLLRG